MKRCTKQIVALILALCLLISSVSTTFASEHYPVSNYYIMKVNASVLKGTSWDEEITFMTRRDSANGSEKLYVKAEDFVFLAGYDYSFAQTSTECTYTCSSSGHVVRFLFRSRLATTIYLGQNLTYTAPFESLFEHGVAWIPFEFATKLFSVNVVATGNAISTETEKYNFCAAGNIVNNDPDNWRFDWVQEVGQSESASKTAHKSAVAVDVFHGLASLEPAAWGSLLLRITGSTYSYDADYAEMIGKAFIVPSEAEIKEIDENDTKIYDSLTNVVLTTGDLEKIKTPDVNSVFTTLSTKVPGLSKSKKFTDAQKLMTNSKFSKGASKIFESYRNFCNTEVVQGGMWTIKGMLGLLEILEYYGVYANKSERATAALNDYANRSERDEARVLREYSSTTGSDCVDAVARCISDNVGELVGEAVNVSGIMNAYVVIYQIGWNMAMNIGWFKHNLESTEHRLTADYAVIYQDESLDFLNTDINAMGNGAYRKNVEKAVNSTYAFLKFSYIARSAASASFSAMIEANEKKNSHLKSAVTELDRKNREVAALLSALEDSLFLPADCSNSWDDEEFIRIIRNEGREIEQPSQNTVILNDLPVFPGLNAPNAITEEEATELVHKTMSKYTAGMMDTMFEGIYTFKCIDKHIDTDKGITFYVVQMAVQNSEDALFFVPSDGSAVFLGEKLSNGSYYYVEIDLIHLSIGDLVKTFSDLYGGIIKEEFEKELAKRQ